MSMRGVLRLAEVQMRVLDMADSKQHYGTRMGLHEMMTDDNGLERLSHKRPGSRLYCRT